MNEVAFRAHAIQASMEQMLHAAALPILSDVQLVVPGVSQLRLCPDPIPDVFVGQPLLVSGKYAGEWPEKVYLIGTMPSGEGGCCLLLAAYCADFLRWRRSKHVCVTRAKSCCVGRHSTQRTLHAHSEARNLAGCPRHKRGLYCRSVLGTSLLHAVSVQDD
jgi:hypothetical protein